MAASFRQITCFVLFLLAFGVIIGDVASAPRKTNFINRLLVNFNSRLAARAASGRAGKQNRVKQAWLDCDNSSTTMAPFISGVCRLPREFGNCFHPQFRYFYNVPTGTCRQFTWSGCGGNGNNFASIEECENACFIQIEQATTTQEIEIEPPPATIKVVEKTRSTTTRRTTTRTTTHKPTTTSTRTTTRKTTTTPQFEIETTATPQFETEPALPTTTTAKPMTTTMQDPRCLMSVNYGSCSQQSWRYYYNTELRVCRIFLWRGCTGNDNRFDTLADCRQNCEPNWRVYIQNGNAGSGSSFSTTVSPIRVLDSSPLIGVRALGGIFHPLITNCPSENILAVFADAEFSECRAACLEIGARCAGFSYNYSDSTCQLMSKPCHDALTPSLKNGTTVYYSKLDLSAIRIAP